MTRVGFFLILVFFFVVDLSFAAYSPAPAPSLGDDSSPQLAPTPVNGSPDSAPSISPVMAASPPAPFASDLAPGNSPASSLAPSPNDASDINNGDINAEGSEEKAGGDGGMSGGKKAGVVIAVVGAACLVGLGGLVYKKRQDNIRRAQYGYAARSEIL
ncbi:Disulfide isomerase L-2 isoform 1 [Hibiscus syriacus]|uniref:Disulfide isomerase L-2 isoform 1 n=1 Tax=Hibiscus syriacus TaxID=106335 RepID=A0A6A2YMH5_HIBSY|nr:cyclin-dependent kinase inhibitor 1C-like [Hibiscus syriacus]KAE8680505.1 Disulfide isomerase L-2 isoform 1 [Hibiscus syriacus]